MSTGQKVAAEVAAVEKRFEVLAREIPAVLESIVGPQVEDLRAGLRAEIQQSVEAHADEVRADGRNKLRSECDRGEGGP